MPVLCIPFPLSYPLVFSLVNLKAKTKQILCVKKERKGKTRNGH